MLVSSVALRCLLLSCAIVVNFVATDGQDTAIDSSNSQRESFLHAKHFERHLKHSKEARRKIEETEEEESKEKEP